MSNELLCIVGGCGLKRVKLNYCFEHYRETRETGVLAERAAHKVGGPCNVCGQDVPAETCYKARGLTFHKEHFCCTDCNKNIIGAQTGFDAGKFYCEPCYMKRFSDNCPRCQQAITAGFVNALGKKWHDYCFTCASCKKPLDEVYNKEGKPYCLPCYEKDDLDGITCGQCHKSVDKYGDLVQCMGHSFHVNCFRCHLGNHKILARDTFFRGNNHLYCQKHWEESKLSEVDKCFGCKELILLEYIKAGDKEFHVDCFHCMACKAPLQIGTARETRDLYFCGKCFAKIPADSSKGVYVNGVYIPPEGKLMTGGQRLVKGYGSQEARPGSVPPAQSKSCDLGTLQLPYEQCPPEIDYRQREQYLSDADFKKVFSMTKEQFLDQPFWKIQKLKKEKNLW